MWLPFSSLRITVWWFQPTPMNSTMFINKVTWDHHPQVKLTARCIKLSILNVIYTCVCIYIYICLHCTDVCVCIQYYTIIYIYIYARTKNMKLLSRQETPNSVERSMAKRDQVTFCKFPLRRSLYRIVYMHMCKLV